MRGATRIFVLAALASLFMGCGDDNYLGSLSDDSSPGACRYQVSMDLDSGNYDAVLASGCANHMDLAAAYLGKAGFEIVNIINVMIDANDSGGNQMDVFMKDLVGNVSGSDIRNLDYSIKNYAMVNSANGYPADMVLDAQFLRSTLVSPTISFTFIKSAIDPDGDGNISDCDINGNSVPDEVDANSCALLVAGGAPDCASLGITVDDSTYLTLSFPGNAGIYNGLVMDYSGVTNAACPESIYYKLLYGSASVAVTSLEKCIDPAYPLIEWNCPYEGSDGMPEDLLSVFNNAMQNSISTLESLGFSPDSEVYAAINSISVDACGGGSCSEAQLQSYLEAQLGL